MHRSCENPVSPVCNELGVPGLRHPRVMALAADRQVSRLADAIAADGPDPDYADAMMLFGRFVGEWDFDWAA